MKHTSPTPTVLCSLSTYLTILLRGSQASSPCCGVPSGCLPGFQRAQRWMCHKNGRQSLALLAEQHTTVPVQRTEQTCQHQS